MGAASGLGTGKGNLMSSVVNQAIEQNNPYNINYSNYTAPQYTPPQNTASNITGEAFNTGVNSNSDLASIIAGLVSSGVFNQQGGNPYAQPETIPPSGLPYGQQQSSMFAHRDVSRNPPQNFNSQMPYGGYQGQSWNPYGNYYASGSATPSNTTNVRPADPNEALKRLSLNTQQQQNQMQNLRI